MLGEPKVPWENQRIGCSCSEKCWGQRTGLWSRCVGRWLRLAPGSPLAALHLSIHNHEISMSPWGCWEDQMRPVARHSLPNQLTTP